MGLLRLGWWVMSRNMLIKQRQKEVGGVRVEAAASQMARRYGLCDRIEPNKSKIDGPMNEPGASTVWKKLSTLRWPRPLAITFCGLIGFLLPAVYGTIVGIPEPADHDEFSYLLGADTFAHGRLTNPSPPLPEFFESPHVLVVPTHNSKSLPARR